MPRQPAQDKKSKSSRRQLRVFLCTNFVYIWLVFGWSLTLYPLGIDFIYLADPGQMQSAAQRVWEMELRLFGDSIALYRVFNILLLYCCMVCILFLTRFVLGGAWWLGSLAAVLTMANPAKSEGILHLSAVADLLPAFAALAALAAWAGWHRHGGGAAYVLALVLGAFASLNFAENAMLPWVMLALYILIPSEHAARALHLIPVSLLGVAALFRHGWMFSHHGFNPVDAIAPLYLAFYPLGLWPSTAALYWQYPALWLVVALVFLALVALLWRKLRDNALIFALLGALLLRAMPLGEFDIVHCRGGGALIVPFALLYIGLAAVWMHIQQHPRWRRQAVVLTTLLCLLFFGLQWQALWHWRQAGAVVKAFQARAAMAVEESNGEPVALLPDFRYHHTAPVALYASVLYDTAFSRELPVTTAMATHYFLPPKGDVTITKWDRIGAEVEVRGVTLAEMLGPDAAAMQPGDDVAYELYQLQLVTREPGGLRFRVYPLGDLLPEKVIPLRNRGEGLALAHSI
jgi:uncharacterized membrane protein YuzA (DUF378 family)